MISGSDIDWYIYQFKQLSPYEWAKWGFLILFLPGVTLFDGGIIGDIRCDHIDTNLVCQHRGGFLFGTINMHPDPLLLHSSTPSLIHSPH